MLHCVGEKISRVDCGDVSSDKLSDFLSDPSRVMFALLDQTRLECLADNRFLYVSRPYQLLKFEIQPEVVFSVDWDGKQMQIVFESCKVSGLGEIEKSLFFTCTAFFRPESECIEAVATAELKLKKTVFSAIVPDPVWLSLGRQVLKVVFKRLDDRCQRRLRKSALRWVRQESKLA